MARTNRTWTSKIGILQFARAYLGLRLYPWQRKILLAIEAGYPVAALVCNNGGKSSVIIPTAVLWFLYNWPAGRCNVLSGSWKQVQDYVWPGINSFAHLPYFEGWEFQTTDLKTPSGGFASGMSSDDPRRVEGAHEGQNSPFFWIVDEAKSLNDTIFDAVMRSTASFFLTTSSAGSAEGRFYDCFNVLRSLFWTIKVSSFDCPHVTDDQRAYDLAYFRNESNPIYRSKHLSEFDQDRTGLILSATALRRALENPPAFSAGARSAFCDFGAVEGGDENVLAVADGNKVEVAAAWSHLDAVQSVRQFIFEFERLRLTPGDIWGDGGGPGAVMIPMLAERGWHITPVDNGAPAIRNDSYTNRGSEIWYEASYSISNNEWILPDDATFFEQATSRRKEYDEKERLRAEPKKNMRRRGVQFSPDRADAVFGAMIVRSAAAFSSQDIPFVQVGHSEFSRRHATFR